MKAVRSQWSVVSKGVFCIALCTMLFALCPFADAQHQTKIAKIGYLGAGPGNAPRRASEFVRRELNKLGYVEGKNIASEYRNADNKPERLPALADELVRLKVDLIYAGGSNAARAAKEATGTIPIVFINVDDPVPIGLVDSLARPGANLTGFANLSGILGGKRLELLKETIPKLARVAVLWDPRLAGSSEQWKAHQPPAKELGLQLHSMEVSNADRLESAFNEAVRAGIAAFTVTRTPIITSRLKQIVDVAAKHRLPAIYHEAEFSESGGLMSYGTDQTEPYRRVAVMIDKILKGTKPADIPVEQPTKFEFVINLKTAKAIGLTIPPNVLARADRVIK
jgi:putative ABC transport system substrate-binding protein